MKTKTFKAVFLSAILALSILTAFKVIRKNYELLRVDFINHTKGQAQNFITSFID